MFKKLETVCAKQASDVGDSLFVLFFLPLVQDKELVVRKVEPVLKCYLGSCFEKNSTLKVQWKRIDR